MFGTIMSLRPDTGKAIVWSEFSKCGLYILRLKSDTSTDELSAGDMIYFRADEAADVGIVSWYQKSSQDSLVQEHMI